MLAAFAGSTAEAAPVNFSVGGTITFADPGNAFGLSVGDSVSLAGTYDDSDYDGIGLGTVSFENGTGNTLQVTLGSIVQNEFNDVDFLDDNFPQVDFLNGRVVDTDIVFVIGENGAIINFESGDTFGGEDEFGNIIEGDWSVATPTSLPEPGSLALLGTACVAFGVVSRRRKVSVRG